MLSVCLPLPHSQEGESPSVPHFVHTCSILCGKSTKTKCLVSFELRSEEVRACFLAAAAEHHFKVGVGSLLDFAFGLFLL